MSGLPFIPDNLLGKVDNLLGKVKSGLDKIGYVVVCNTCNTLFLSTTCLGVKQMIEKGLWRLDKPMKWYAEACVHWANNVTHSINVWLIVEGKHRELAYSISGDLQRQMIEQGYNQEQIRKELNTFLKGLAWE